MTAPFTTVLLTLLLSFSAVSGQASASPEAQVADNVFVVPDAKAKVVTLWMIVHAGCEDEEGGQCHGLAHYLEHLMFLGRSGEHSENQSLFFAAGQTNAFTSMLATSYYQSVPAKAESIGPDLEQLFQLFSERLAKIEPPLKAADRERNVVLQEFNFRLSDSFRVRFNNAVNARLLPGHPFSQAVIGSKDDIAAYTVERAQAFHQRWYAKNNASFIVYGPVDPALVKQLASKYLDPLPEKTIPGRSWLDARRTFAPMDEGANGADESVVRPEIQFEKIVRFEEPFPQQTRAAKAILFDYLNSEITGSLSDALVEDKKLATHISADRSSIGDGAMWFTTYGTLEDGVAPQTLKTAILDYYEQLAKTGLDARVIERLKKRRLREIADIAADPKKTLTSLQSWLSSNGKYQDWQDSARNFEAVTPQSITPLLQAMAGPGRQLFGTMAPAGIADNAAAAPGGNRIP